MNHGEPERALRLAQVITGVVRQALLDAGAAGIGLQDADTPEGALAADWCRSALGEGRVFTGEVEAQVLSAHPASKTLLLLAEAPAAVLLPLGDLYASEVQALTGGWSGPETLRALAEAAGGIEPLDAALREWAEGRVPLERALSTLPASARPQVAEALSAQRWRRGRLGLIPKLGGRTIGIDLWE